MRVNDDSIALKKTSQEQHFTLYLYIMTKANKMSDKKRNNNEFLMEKH